MHMRLVPNLSVHPTCTSAATLHRQLTLTPRTRLSPEDILGERVLGSPSQWHLVPHSEKLMNTAVFKLNTLEF